MLSPGTRVGPFEIVSWLGAGGMGEVYRARDVNLAREVALKTLPEDLAGQPDRLARLKQEARILASLNHPGIATLHGLEQSNGGVPFLVMELVEGESLSDRLRRGPLPLREAMTVAHEMALALEAAHEKGVLHRDLKPGNIRRGLDGRVKLLDFGLAKVVRDVALDSQLATKTAPASPGSVEGTAPYMSPEQARGQDVDHRSDVWAFGCVLYELLTGKRAFGGATFSDTVAAILEHEPGWQALPQGTPSAVLKLLRRCLQKEKDKRLRDIGDARLEIEDILAAPASTENVVARPGRRALWPVMAALAAMVAIGSWVIQRSPTVPREVVRLSLEGSEEGDMGSPILSPTGERVVYRTPSGLVVRELDKAEGRVIPGTGAAIRPFFSPDGKWIAYHDGADRTLKSVSLSGGVPVRVCGNVRLSYGATWGPDGTIVIAVDSFSGLWQVSAAGGEPRELTKPDRAQGEKTHRNPHYLPGGRAILFTVGTNRLASWDDARIELLELANGNRRTLIEGGTAPAYVESGHLVYLRGTSILAVPFDLGRLAVTGTPMAVVEGVQSQSLTYGAPTFTVARTGTLVYWPHQGNAQRLVVVDRAGRGRPLSPFVEGPLVEPRLSPDGGAVALRRSGATDQVWRFDIARESLSQVTFEWDNMAPIWTSDGASLIVTSSPGWKLHRVRADGSGVAEGLATAGVAGQFPGSVSAGFLAFREIGKESREDIWVAPLEAGGEPRAFLHTPAREAFPALSPSGRSLAYESDESGQDEIYVRTFPEGTSKVKVSTGGGIEPVWARNGKELFYRRPLEGSKGRMMVVDVSEGPPIHVSAVRGLFEDSHLIGGNTPGYDVFPDGQHFVMIEVDPDARPITHAKVILNWFEELKRLVPSR